jgi:hypothetical protein
LGLCRIEIFIIFIRYAYGHHLWRPSSPENVRSGPYRRCAGLLSRFKE